MSQSSLERSTRRTLPAFSHTPSRLAHSSSRQDLSSQASGSTRDSPSSSTSFATSPSLNALSSYTTPTRADSSLKYRSLGTSTQSPHTPLTPKIHYSPHATTTPREALSRSSSIPFDMAASAKAGRKAEEESRRKSMTPVVGDKPKTKRFVRSKSLFQREIPESIVDLVSLHYPMTVQEILPPSRFANPIGLALHALQWLLLAPLIASSDTSDSVLRTKPLRTGVGSRWERWEEEGHTARSGFGGRWTTFIVTLIFVALACANSVYLFTKFRTYDMQLRSANDPVRSPHASPISAPRSSGEDDVFGGATTESSSSPAYDTRERKILRWAGKSLVSLVKWSFWTVLSIFGHQSSKSTSFAGPGEKIQSLRVWEPPEFCLAFFCAYPPSAPILSYLLTPLHPFLMPLLHLIISFLLSHLSLSYGQLVKDRMLLSAEVMKEYDRRFVYKKVFGLRVDRSVQTEQAESLW